jgi:hypothetical protein
MPISITSSKLLTHGNFVVKDDKIEPMISHQTVSRVIAMEKIIDEYKIRKKSISGFGSNLFEFDHSFFDDDFGEIRVNFQFQANNSMIFSAVLMLNSIPISKYDFHTNYRGKRNWWHEHLWDEAAQSCEYLRTDIQDQSLIFYLEKIPENPADNMNEAIKRIMKIWNILDINQGIWYIP